jgi:mycothiol S-conjugate amidase
MRTLLAIHAHPDDESSKGAATVAHYAAAGVHCVLVTATGGEAGDILNPAMDRPDVKERLAGLRREELQEAARIIGYSEVRELGYRDSGMPDTEANAHAAALVNASHEEVLGRLVAIVRELRPDVIFGYDDHERYPHPDHLAVHRLALDLFDVAADPNRFPGTGNAWSAARLFAPVFTVRRIRALHDASIDRGLESPFQRWIDSLDGATDDGKLLVSVDVADTLEVGRDALRAHRTQIDPDGFWFKLPTDVVAEVYPYEDFELLRARVPLPEGAKDLFAGL